MSIKRGSSLPGNLDSVQQLGLKQLRELYSSPIPQPGAICFHRGQPLLRGIQAASSLPPRPPSGDAAGSSSGSSATDLMEMLSNVDKMVHAGVQKFPQFKGSSPHDDLLLQVSIAKVWAGYLSELVKNNNHPAQLAAMSKVTETLEKMTVEIPKALEDLHQYEFTCDDPLEDKATMTAALLIQEEMNDKTMRMLVISNSQLKAELEMLKQNLSVVDGLKADLAMKENLIEAKNKEVEDVKMELNSSRERILFLEHAGKALEDAAQQKDDQVRQCVAAMEAPFEALKRLHT